MSHSIFCPIKRPVRSNAFSFQMSRDFSAEHQCKNPVLCFKMPNRTKIPWCFQHSMTHIITAGMAGNVLHRRPHRPIPFPFLCHSNTAISSLFPSPCSTSDGELHLSPQGQAQAMWLMKMHRPDSHARTPDTSVHKPTHSLGRHFFFRCRAADRERGEG